MTRNARRSSFAFCVNVTISSGAKMRMGLLVRCGAVSLPCARKVILYPSIKSPAAAIEHACFTWRIP
jgi:hypothetical protein